MRRHRVSPRRRRGARRRRTHSTKIGFVTARHFVLEVTTANVRVFTARRQAAGASINRNLILLKRMCTLAMQAGKLTVRPYIPLLKENNVRKGFFEPEQFKSARNHLPVHLQAIVDFANITGWRTPREILPLEWRQVDMKAGEVRLDPGTTKNGEGRVFPLAVTRLPFIQALFVDPLRTDRAVVLLVVPFTGHPRPYSYRRDHRAAADDPDLHRPRHAGDPR